MKTEITIGAVKAKQGNIVKCCEGCLFSSANGCELPEDVENSGIVKCEDGYIYKIKDIKK